MVVRIIILCILSFLFVTHRIEDYIVLKNIDNDNPMSDRLVDIFKKWGFFWTNAYSVWKCLVSILVASLSGYLIGELNLVTMLIETVIVVGGVTPTVIVLYKVNRKMSTM